MLIPEITFKEIDAPINNFCCSGHIAPEKFEEKQTKFYKVSGKISGIYCEVCLTLANHMAKEKRHGLR